MNIFKNAIAPITFKPYDTVEQSKITTAYCIRNNNFYKKYTINFLETNISSQQSRQNHLN